MMTLTPYPNPNQARPGPLNQDEPLTLTLTLAPTLTPTLPLTLALTLTPTLTLTLTLAPTRPPGVSGSRRSSQTGA